MKNTETKLNKSADNIDTQSTLLLSFLIGKLTNTNYLMRVWVLCLQSKT